MGFFRVPVAALLIAGLGGPSALLAENGGRVSGRAVDAVGRPLVDLRVELVQAFRGQPAGVTVQASLTDGRGSWSFSGVPAGQYVVRMVRQQQTTGLPVSVADDAGVAGVLIVAPSLPLRESLRQARPGGRAAREPGDVAAWMIGVTGGIATTLGAINVVGLILRDAS